MMTEAEVSLRVAMHYIENNLVSSNVKVAIDGAQVQTGNRVHFDVVNFLKDQGWVNNADPQRWQGLYTKSGCGHAIEVHANPGRGDVIAVLNTGNTLRVESKKGPLIRSKSSIEYRLLREAIGQLMTVDTIEDHDILAVAVPESDKNKKLIARWAEAPLIKKNDILFITVNKKGSINISPSNNRLKLTAALPKILGPRSLA